MTTWSRCRCSTLTSPGMSSCRTVCERFVSSWPCMRSGLGLNILLASKIGWLTCAPGCTFLITIRCFMNAIKFGALSLRWSPLSFLNFAICGRSGCLALFRFCIIFGILYYCRGGVGFPAPGCWPHKESCPCFRHVPQSGNSVEGLLHVLYLF